MTQTDRDLVYKTLTDCTRALNEDISTGSAAVYVTIDRAAFNDLLREIADAKKVLVRP